LAIFTQFDEEVLIEPVKILLQLFFRNDHTFQGVCRIVVDVGEKDGLRELGFDMLARASITVSTCAYLEIKSAIDSVLLCPAIISRAEG